MIFSVLSVSSSVLQTDSVSSIISMQRFLLMQIDANGSSTKLVTAGFLCRGFYVAGDAGHGQRIILSQEQSISVRNQVFERICNEPVHSYFDENSSLYNGIIRQNTTFVRSIIGN